MLVLTRKPGQAVLLSQAGKALGRLEVETIDAPPPAHYVTPPGPRRVWIAWQTPGQTPRTAWRCALDVKEALQLSSARVQLLRVAGGRCGPAVLGFDAPESVNILREEVEDHEGKRTG